MTKRQRGAADLNFLTWGNHRATNDYAECRHLMLAGTLFYRASYYEGLARLSLNKRAAQGTSPRQNGNGPRWGNTAI